MLWMIMLACALLLLLRFALTFRVGEFSFELDVIGEFLLALGGVRFYWEGGGLDFFIGGRRDQSRSLAWGKDKRILGLMFGGLRLVLMDSRSSLLR